MKFKQLFKRLKDYILAEFDLLDQSSITINGRRYDGNNIQITESGKIIIDGKEVHKENSKKLSIIVHGHAQNVLATSGDVEVIGNVESVHTNSGDISCTDILKNASSQSGDIIATRIYGNASVQSGDICH